MANLIQLEEQLKGLPDDALAKEMQSPSGMLPPYMIMSEMTRRQKTRESYTASQAKPSATVAQEMLNQYSKQANAPKQTGLPSMPNIGPPAAPPSAGGMPPKAFAKGGPVSMHPYEQFERGRDKLESKSDYNARNAMGSGAFGRYQFMPSTWNEIARKRPDLKLPMVEKGGKIPSKDEQDRAYREAFLPRSVANLQKQGIDANPLTLYLAHKYGDNAVPSLLQSDSNRSMADWAREVYGKGRGNLVVKQNRLGGLTIGKELARLKKTLGTEGVPVQQSNPLMTPQLSTPADVETEMASMIPGVDTPEIPVAEIMNAPYNPPDTGPALSMDDIINKYAGQAEPVQEPGLMQHFAQIVAAQEKAKADAQAAMAQNPVKIMNQEYEAVVQEPPKVVRGGVVLPLGKIPGQVPQPNPPPDLSKFAGKFRFAGGGGVPSNTVVLPLKQSNDVIVRGGKQYRKRDWGDGYYDDNGEQLPPGNFLESIDSGIARSQAARQKIRDDLKQWNVNDNDTGLAAIGKTLAGFPMAGAALVGETALAAGEVPGRVVGGAAQMAQGAGGWLTDTSSGLGRWLTTSPAERAAQGDATITPSGNRVSLTAPGAGAGYGFPAAPTYNVEPIGDIPPAEASPLEQILNGGGGAAQAGGSGNDFGAVFDTVAAKMPDRMSKLDAEYQALSDSIMQDREMAKNMALANAGFAIASGTSPFFAENVGKGAMVGLNDYQQALANERKGKVELLRNRVDIAGQQAQQDRTALQAATTIYGDNLRYKGEQLMAEVRALAKGAGGSDKLTETMLERATSIYLEQLKNPLLQAQVSNASPEDRAAMLDKMALEAKRAVLKMMVSGVS